MNPRNSPTRRHHRHIKDDIPNLSIEDIRRAKAQIGTSIRIPLDHADVAWARRPRRAGEQSGHAVRVADDLRVVVVDDCGADEVGAGRDVDDGGHVGEGLAGGDGGAVGGGDGGLDGCCVVCDTVACIVLASSRSKRKLAAYLPIAP